MFDVLIRQPTATVDRRGSQSRNQLLAGTQGRVTSRVCYPANGPAI